MEVTIVKGIKTWQFWTMLIVWGMLLLFIAFDTMSMNRSFESIAQSLSSIAETTDPANRIKMFDEIFKGLQ